MPAYDDRRFSPAAPVIIATLRNPKSGEVLADVPMLIDSGADVTLLPREMAGSLGIESAGIYELMGFDGTKSMAEAVRADLLFLRKTFRGQFLLVDQDIGILGRDILNNISLFLDGPRLVWQEQSSTNRT